MRHSLLAFSIVRFAPRLVNHCAPHVKIVFVRISLYLGSGQKLSGNPIAGGRF